MATEQEEVEAVGMAIAERLLALSNLELRSRERLLGAKAAIKTLDALRAKGSPQ